MPVYGLQTFKANGTTVVLQNSTPSAVYAKFISLNNTGTGATRSTPIPTRPAYYYYYIDLIFLLQNRLVLTFHQILENMLYKSLI
jgi:hypothetical protein